MAIQPTDRRYRIFFITILGPGKIAESTDFDVVSVLRVARDLASCDKSVDLNAITEAMYSPKIKPGWTYLGGEFVIVCTA